MSIRFVPFEEIDKNKWNGTVHYAPNGNIYGYHWYLKSIIKEWDALVEGDYQSVMPIFRNLVTDFQLACLPELGPYTVHAVSDDRCDLFYKWWDQHSTDKNYHFNHAFTAPLQTLYPDKFLPGTMEFIDMNMSHLDLQNAYHPDAKEALQKQNDDIFEYGGQGKPELLLENENINIENKSTLYRLFYQAIQRSAGYHSRLTNMHTGLQANFFIMSFQKELYISYAGQNNDAATELKLLDTLIKSNLGSHQGLFLPIEMAIKWFKAGIRHHKILGSKAGKPKEILAWVSQIGQN
ncbi:MAG: hypothetical protein IPL08_05540 [Saprospiraceae bacterium]|nr:hypothetical protein [Saprospiraceae bacterium]